MITLVWGRVAAADWDLEVWALGEDTPLEVSTGLVATGFTVKTGPLVAKDGPGCPAFFSGMGSSFGLTGTWDGLIRMLLLDVYDDCLARPGCASCTSVDAAAADAGGAFVEVGLLGVTWADGVLLVLGLAAAVGCLAVAVVLGSSGAGYLGKTAYGLAVVELTNADCFTSGNLF